MPPVPPQHLVHGWVSSPDARGTRDILLSALSTIWLCTWTSLCLNIPSQETRDGRYRWLLKKLRWQLFAIFFPEVLVATAAEQWLSARQSARAFAELGYPQWTIRQAFFADMGGIVVAPPDCTPFPVDSQQLEYLVKHKYIELPDISPDDIRSMNKADGVVRLVTMAQMAWYCLSCAARGASSRLGFSSLEATTLAYILCTVHTFFFWYYKPLDPGTQRIYRIGTRISDICQRSGRVERDYLRRYRHTPLDFVKPQPDPKSLITPFWFGLGAVFRPCAGRRKASGEASVPVRTFEDSRVLPQEGISTALMVYTLLFQVAYFGLHIAFAWISSFPSQTEWYLWVGSAAVDFGLIAIYVLAIPVGMCFTPFLGRLLFDMEATHLLEVASALPTWAKLLIHGPFVLGYMVARAAILAESVLSLRALPESAYRNVDWTGFLPHV